MQLILLRIVDLDIQWFVLCDLGVECEAGFLAKREGTADLNHV